MEATRFLEQVSDVKIYHGYFPECLCNITSSIAFDLIYMNVVEYTFNETDLLKLLTDVKNYKAKTFLLVSASVYNNAFPPLQRIKATAKLLLSFIGLYNPGQFWGYMRTPDEFIKAFKEAGFKNIEDGYLQNGQYWIKGRC